MTGETEMKNIAAAADEAQKPVVLIVDDDSTARLALAAAAHADGHRIAFACSALDAQERMEHIDPDVVVCDLMMEEMRGDDLCRWMKSHPQWRLVPIVAVTELDNPILRADLLGSGADSVLTKKNVSRELRAHVLAALRVRSTYVELLGMDGRPRSALAS